MNISKFLLIDAALVIASIPVVFLIQGGNKKSYILRASDKKYWLKKTSIKLPGKEKLLELEKIAKTQGSGIGLNSLFGNWKFISVWKKDSDDENSIFSSLLRVFSANLEFRRDISSDFPFVFSIITSIQFGLISIKFSGEGYLKEEQPLLHFFFNLIELKLGSNILLTRSINKPVEKEKSFFELIALDESNRWLSARIKGGSLILWLKE